MKREVSVIMEQEASIAVEREASVASSTDFYEPDKEPDTDAQALQEQVPQGKRKASETDLSLDKKRKLECLPATSSGLEPCAGLPPAAWQRIFLYCPISTLGRLLQVNRSFLSYLTQVRDVATAKPHGLRLLKSESIWASARNMHPTKPPKPLPGFSERQMWQLVWSATCQYCGKQNTFTPGEKVWQKGPDATGVRVIWPFGVRACGPCLLQACQTDASLLFSTSSALRPALSFAFVTSDQNYIPAYTLQAATTPVGVEIVKYFFKAHVQDIATELQHALSLGPAAAEEWSKGLESRGKDRMRVAENWERWEAKYQWWKDHQEPKRAVSVTRSPPLTIHHLPTKPPTHDPSSPVIHAPVPASKYISIPSAVEQVAAISNPRRSSVSVPCVAASAPMVQYTQPRPPTIPPQGFTPQPTPGTGPSGQRGERNLHDANEAKASRKQDIERRCQLMQPPILPNVLRHMDSFKAAIQIPQPMNDYAWRMLQPRLLAQLPAAQQAESDHTSRLASMTTRAADRRQQDASLKEVKEVIDREWEEFQRPIRDRLSALADEFINQDWDRGRAVTYDNSPKFAADLLMYVRRKFYDELEKEVAPQTPDRSDRSRPELVLENMKWVYDNKLKVLTEVFRKELFLCYGNGCEANARFYGFEGVIQHFGAKHTNAFSVGNVVVAWREAEWPEETPFHPDPISAKRAFHGNDQGQSGPGSYYGGYMRGGTSTPQMPPHLPQASPGPYSYGGHYNGPFAPPQANAHGMSGYDYSGSYRPQLDPYSYQPMGPPGYGPQLGTNGYATSPATSNAAVAPPPAKHNQKQGLIDPQAKSGNGNGEYRTQFLSLQARPQDHPYDRQVNTIIEMAQDTWKQTSGIKDFPNNLRIYVLLHRVIYKFQVEFNHEPTLSHFVDALSSHETSQALKNAPGLSCKACEEDFSRASATFPFRVEERRTYTVSTLFVHFQFQHVMFKDPSIGNGNSPTKWDWKEDMIELPSDRFISGLIHAPGMDDDKLYMVATVFPKLFPTPLPRIGGIDNHGMASPALSILREKRDVAKTAGTPGPSSLASPLTGSPIPPKASEDEYDPRRPALPSDSILTSRSSERKLAYYAEPQYYVGSRFYPYEPERGPGNSTHHLRPTEYVQVAPGRDDYNYTHPRGQYYEYEPQPEYRFLGESGARELGRSRAHAEADRFLDELSGLPSAKVIPHKGLDSRPAPKAPIAEQDSDDGSRYTPPPPDIAAAGLPSVPGRLSSAAHPTTLSTVSNAHHRKDRPHDQVPSRYNRYASTAREEPFSRGASVNRAQGKKYERYEEQRRRIDQQEIPRPAADREHEPSYSRDQSIDQAPLDDVYYQGHPVPRGYVSVQDRFHSRSPPRYHRAPAPMYVDEYGRPVEEYEVIHVSRDPKPYLPARYYPERESSHVQYVYDRPSYKNDGRPAEFVYYEEQQRPPPVRKPVFDPDTEASYEPRPPPAVGQEGASAPVSEIS